MITKFKKPAEWLDQGRVPCANLQCTNKLRVRVGSKAATTVGGKPRFCARCNRKQREERGSDIRGPKPNLTGGSGPAYQNDIIENSDDVFDAIWDSVIKGKFQGYSKNTISGRAERAGKARAWNQSRKVKRGRTRKRYARNKTRGNVRPKMRRQLGAGGSRQETKR